MIETIMQTMTIPHIIILSDSENESDEPLGTPTYNPYLDSESEPEEHMDTDTGPDSDDSVDEEMVMENPPAPLSPPLDTYDRSGPHTIRGPRKSVANSCHRQNPPPTPVVTPVAPPVAPANDPYRIPFGYGPIVGHIRETLQGWRKLHDIPSTHETGESSSAPSYNPITGEPIHHTIPLLVAQTDRQDDRLDLMEGVIMDLPLNELKEQIDTVADQTTTMHQEIMEVKEKTTEGADQVKIMKERLDGIEARMELFDAMITAMKDITTKLLKKQSDPK